MRDRFEVKLWLLSELYFGSFDILKANVAPIKPAVRADRVLLVRTPATLKPRTMRVGANNALTTAWMIEMNAVLSILSRPLNMLFDVVMSTLPRIMMEDKRMREPISGL